MDGVREELLARAGLAREHDRQIVARRRHRKVHRPTKTRRVAEDAAEVVPGRAAVGRAGRWPSIGGRADAQDGPDPRSLVAHGGQDRRRAVGVQLHLAGEPCSRCAQCLDHRVAGRRTESSSLEDVRPRCRLVHGRDPPVAVDRDERLPRLAGRAEGVPHDFVPDACRCAEPFLDRAGDRHHEGGCLSPPDLPGTRHDDDADGRRRAGCPDGNGRAAPALPGGDVVLAGKHLDGLARHERGAGAVRPGGLLRPARARAVADLRQRLGDAPVAVEREHGAFRVEVGEDVVVEFHTSREIVENGRGEAEALVARTPLLQCTRGDRHARTAQVRIDVVGLPRPPPGAQDFLADSPWLDSLQELLPRPFQKQAPREA